MCKSTTRRDVGSLLHAPVPAHDLFPLTESRDNDGGNHQVKLHRKPLSKNKRHLNIAGGLRTSITCSTSCGTGTCKICSPVQSENCSCRVDLTSSIYNSWKRCIHNVLHGHPDKLLGNLRKRDIQNLFAKPFGNLLMKKQPRHFKKSFKNLSHWHIDNNSWNRPRSVYQPFQKFAKPGNFRHFNSLFETPKNWHIDGNLWNGNVHVLFLNPLRNFHLSKLRRPHHFNDVFQNLGHWHIDDNSWIRIAHDL